MVQIQIGPEWKPVLGAEVLFAPVTESMIRRARAAYFEVVGATDADVTDGSPPDLVANAQRAADALGAFCRSLVTDGVRDWKGVNDTKGRSLEVTPAHVAACLDDPEFGPELSTVYAIPVWLRELEKNASSPSQAGAIAGSKAKKGKAPRSTAKGSAKGVPAATTASPTPIGPATATRRRPARSSGTPAKPTKGKRSGT